MTTPRIIRENNIGRIAHPDTLPSGQRVWMDPEVRDILTKLQKGDPTLGWEGDPRLALYRSFATDVWEVWRMEADGEYRMFMRSKPGAKLNESLIQHIVAHDARRGFDPHAEVSRANEVVRTAIEKRNADRMEAAQERMRWALLRDLGAHV
jgi:hypothetical protein